MLRPGCRTRSNYSLVFLTAAQRRPSGLLTCGDLITSAQSPDDHQLHGFRAASAASTGLWVQSREDLLETATTVLLTSPGVIIITFPQNAAFSAWPQSAAASTFSHGCTAACIFISLFWKMNHRSRCLRNEWNGNNNVCSGPVKTLLFSGDTAAVNAPQSVRAAQQEVKIYCHAWKSFSYNTF